MSLSKLVNVDENERNTPRHANYWTTRRTTKRTTANTPAEQKRKQILCTTEAEAQFAETKVTDRKGTSTMRLEETGPTKLYILP